MNYVLIPAHKKINDFPIMNETFAMKTIFFIFPPRIHPLVYFKDLSININHKSIKQIKIQIIRSINEKSP